MIKTTPVTAVESPGVGVKAQRAQVGRAILQKLTRIEVGVQVSEGVLVCIQFPDGIIRAHTNLSSRILQRHFAG